eukprot:g25763.t1
MLRVGMSPQYLPCPRGTGKVPACVLLQRFPFMSDFNSEDMDILVRRYTDAHDGFVRMQALERDVLHIIQDRGAEDAALGIHSDPDEDDAAEEVPGLNSKPQFAKLYLLFTKHNMRM